MKLTELGHLMLMQAPGFQPVLLCVWKTDTITGQEAV